MKAILLVFCLLVRTLQGAIIYNNTRALEGPETTLTEIGDQIAFDGTERLITDFGFDFYIKTMGGGDPKLRLRLYLNDGPADPASGFPTPGTKIYESILVSAFSFFREYGAVEIHGLKVLVNGDSLTWAVEFSGLPPDGQAGLLRCGPPTVGSSGDFIWQKDQNGAWRAVTQPGKMNNFSARVTADPAPNSNPTVEQQIDLSAKFNFLGIELLSGSNKVSELFPDAPVGMVLYKYDNARGYSAFQKYESGWSQPEALILPGEALVAVLPPSLENTNVTVSYRRTLRGTSPPTFPPLFRGWNLISGGRLQPSSNPKVAPGDGDVVYVFDNKVSTYKVSSWDFASAQWQPPLQTVPGDGVRYLAGSTWRVNPAGNATPEGTPVYANNLSPAYGNNARFVSASGVPLTGQAQLYVLTPERGRIAVGAPISIGTGEWAGYLDPAANLIRYIDGTFASSSVDVILAIDGPEGSGETFPVQVFLSPGGAMPTIATGLTGLKFAATPPLPEFLVEPQSVPASVGDVITVRAVFNYPGNVQPGTSLTNDPGCGPETACAVTYQWQKRSGPNWLSVAGATSDTLRFENITTSDFGVYRLSVSGRTFQALSAEVTVGNTISVKIGEWAQADQSIRLGVEASFGNENFYLLETSEDLKSWKPVSCPLQIGNARTSSAIIQESGAPRSLFVRVRAAESMESLRTGLEGLQCE